MVTPPAAPVGNQSTLQAQQAVVIPESSKANLNKLIASVGKHQTSSDTPVANTTPVANLQSHGVGTQAHHSA